MEDEASRWWYSNWLFEMWAKDYGSYNDIEWALFKGLLTAGKEPHKLLRPVVKWIIRLHAKWESRNDIG